MMINKFIKGLMLKTFFLCLLYSCSNKENNQSSQNTYSIKLVDSIITNTFIPNSYVFSSVPIYEGEAYYYLDKNLGRVISLDSDFKFNTVVLEEGEGPNTLKKIYYINSVEDYLFAFGNNECVVFNIGAQNIEGKYDFPFRLSQQIVYDKVNDRFITTHLNDENVLEIRSFLFSAKKGVYDVKVHGHIGFDPELSYMEYSGWFVFINDQLFYVKDWVGEVVYIDSELLTVQNQVQLPYSGDLEDNKQYEHVDTYISNYYQAYSIEDYKGDLWVLREVDWETELKGEKSMDNPNFVKKIRNRVHIFDANLNLKGSLKLNRPATYIKIIGSQLFTLNYEDETIYIYDIEG